MMNHARWVNSHFKLRKLTYIFINHKSDLKIFSLCVSVLCWIQTIKEFFNKKSSKAFRLEGDFIEIF